MLGHTQHPQGLIWHLGVDVSAQFCHVYNAVVGANAFKTVCLALHGLQKAVREERFEDAAKLRDEIIGLKNERHQS